jgi:ATP-binding cassette subfamily B protein
MKALIFIREIIKRFPVLLLVTTLTMLISSLLEAVALFSIAPIVDLLINQGLQGASSITQKMATLMEYIGMPVTLTSFLAFFLALNVLKSGFQIVANYLIIKTQYAVHCNIMLETFEDFFKSRWYFFVSKQQGKLLNTFTREIKLVGDSFRVMALFFAENLQAVTYLAITFYIAWQVASLCVVSALLIALPFLLLGRISVRLGRACTKTSNQYTSIIHESFSLAKVILGFANQQKNVRALSHAFDGYSRAEIKSSTIHTAIPLMFYPFGLSILAILVLFAQFLSVPLSEISVIMYAFLKAVPLIGQIVAGKNKIDNIFPSYEQVMDLQHDAKQLKQQSGTRIFTGFDKEIAMDGFSFHYPGHEFTLLDININIPKGKMIAFVGESGAGKSTLIDIVMGFNEANTGKITIDGTPLQNFDINSYRQRIGYVPQDSVLFNTTIRDNLLWSKDDVTEGEIEEACKLANAHEFIESFPDGYNTLVGDRGIRLSGGQIQRLALARAILRNPDLLILDEATSSLDTHSECLIQEAIDNIAKQTTVIIVAHRLSTIKNADYVYVIKKGRVIEEGTFSKLITMNGYFNHMIELQALETPRSSEKDLVI